MKKVAVFGSFVVDLMARSPHLPVPGETVKGSMFKMGPGGKGFNQCVAAHKAGADVVMMTKIGTDTFANVMLDTMTELNMPKDNIFITKETETGIALILVDENSSQNEIIIVPGACNTITAEEVASVENVIKECEYVLLQLEVNQDANEMIVDMANKYGCKVIMNTAPYAPMTDEFLAARVQSALPTGGEGYDMNAIAAAVIGGASLAGGKGTVTGTVLGTILMVLINNAGVQFGLNTHVLEITSGVLIIFAVTMDMLKNRKKA